MPAYAYIQQLLSSPSAKERGKGLSGLSLIGGLSCEENEKLAEEPGLLAALNPILIAPDTAFLVLELLFVIVSAPPSSKTLCLAPVFSSPVFPTLTKIAALGAPPLSQSAWLVIANLSGVDKHLKKVFFDSPGIVALLQGGIKSADLSIAENASVTLSNLCRNAEVASAVLDDQPELVRALVDTFSTRGVGLRFRVGCRALKLIAHSSERAAKLRRDHPGFVEAASKAVASAAPTDGNKDALRDFRKFAARFPEPAPEKEEEAAGRAVVVAESERREGEESEKREGAKSDREVVIAKLRNENEELKILVEALREDLRRTRVE